MLPDLAPYLILCLLISVGLLSVAVIVLAVLQWLASKDVSDLESDVDIGFDTLRKIIDNDFRSELINLSVKVKRLEEGRFNAEWADRIAKLEAIAERNYSAMRGLLNSLERCIVTIPGVTDLDEAHVDQED